MDLGETLFAIGWRWLRERRRGALRGTAIDVADRRLLALAGLCAGRAVRLHHAESVGGVRGHVVLLPDRLDLGDVDLEVETILLRVCLAATAVPLGPRIATLSVGRADDERAWLAHLAWMGAARDAFVDAFPVAALRLRAIGARLDHEAARRSMAASEASNREASEGPLHAWLGRLHRGEPMPTEAEIRALCDAHPAAWPLPQGSALYGGPLAARDAAAAEALMADDALRATLPKGNERRAPARDVLQRVRLQQDEAPPLPVHVFEKVDTLDSFQGGRRKVDGSDELAAHADALEEVDLRAIVRGGRDVASILRLDTHGLDAGDDAPERGESDGTTLRLDEWNVGSGSYRRGWVHARLRTASERAPAWVGEARRRLGREVRTLERTIGHDRTRRRAMLRQPDGNDIDLDALVEERAAASAGHGRFDRVDIAERRTLRDVATLVLLDLSLSSDAWVGGGEQHEGRRVLDLTRDAAFVVGEVGWRLGDRVAMLGFASQTRHHVELTRLLDWHERWPDAVARLGALRPRGYTRIGPALRHGRTMLADSGARHRVMILVTDGKPTDDDRYEGRYGVADVRQAVREAERDGVDVLALCLDRSAAATMPVMVGAGRFELLRDPLELPTRLAAAWRRHAAR